MNSSYYQMKGPIVVAVCGARRAGKDTVASFLETENGFKGFKFARYLKDMVKAGFGLSDEEVEGCSKDCIHPLYQVSPRTILQYIGTEVMQYGIQNILSGIDRSFWANRLLLDVKHTFKSDPDARIVISDLRFMHEYVALKEASLQYGYSLFLIKICRNDNNGKSVCKEEGAEATDRHVSEKEWETLPFDFSLCNDEHTEQLHEKIRQIMLQILPGSS